MWTLFNIYNLNLNLYTDNHIYILKIIAYFLIYISNIIFYYS